MFYNRQQLSFEREEEWGFRTTISLKTEENEACGDLFFKPLSMVGMEDAMIGQGKFRTTEARIELRYAPGETFINTKQRRLPVNLDAPVFTLSHTTGIKGFLGGDYDYNFTEASIYKRLWLNSWGKIDILAKGGIQWNKVPFPLLIMPAANLSYIISDETFNLINNMEFLNDRYASLDISWDLNGKYSTAYRSSKTKVARVAWHKMPLGHTYRQEQPYPGSKRRRRYVNGIPGRFIHNGQQAAVYRANCRNPQYIQDYTYSVCTPSELQPSAYGNQERRKAYDATYVLRHGDTEIR